MMKISLLIFLCINVAVASDYHFIDQPTEMTIQNKVVKVTFLMRAARYEVNEKSKCFKILERAIKSGENVDVAFSPKLLKILTCEKAH